MAGLDVVGPLTPSNGPYVVDVSDALFYRQHVATRDGQEDKFKSLQYPFFFFEKFTYYDVHSLVTMEIF